MPRRLDLPGADELFRPTTDPASDAAAPPQLSGRVKHDDKITVYVSGEELLALEQLRLTLRASHGLAVDRGRIVRAAIADAVADVHANGAEARLVQRLTTP